MIWLMVQNLKDFEEINESYLNQESGFIIGTITLANLKIIAERENADSSIVLFNTVKTQIFKNRKLEYELSN